MEDGLEETRPGVTNLLGGCWSNPELGVGGGERVIGIE